MLLAQVNAFALFLAKPSLPTIPPEVPECNAFRKLPAMVIPLSHYHHHKKSEEAHFEYVVF